MVKWAEVVKDWPYKQPPHFWTHWGHDVYCEDDPFWSEEHPNPMVLCRTCKCWWRK